MKFTDKQIDELNLKDVNDLTQLIIEYLCGERYICGKEHYKKVNNCGTEGDSNNYIEQFRYNKELLAAFIKNADKMRLNYEQFNELLLLLNQNRVNKPFFDFFFLGKRENNETGKNEIQLVELKKGVNNFRGYAMLRYGNFRFAYKKLTKINDLESLKKELEPYSKSNDLEHNRPPKMLVIDPIDRENTWYLGETTMKKFDKEYELLKKEPQKLENVEELLTIVEKTDKMIEDAKAKALKNTDIYLTWDYMDVYIATSMRKKWEFEETHDFIKSVFNDEKIKNLKLRYFDPTQSKCNHRINKGLVEGLMLKRAACCIYMVQETDTMGKDSELAVTLAQGKPVIAYIPYIDINKYPEKIKSYPLDYFDKRLLILNAEIFDDKDCQTELEKLNENYAEIIKKFRSKLDAHRTKQPYTLWQRKEQEFKNKCEEFDEICRIISIAEHFNFEKRANILKQWHPLALQVNLQTGVANGLLVVRDHQKCAELLYKILTNQLAFEIEYDKKCTILKEEISGCPHRVVTDYEKLTNSFWNFYLT